MKPQPGLLYFSTVRGHLCTPIDEGKYKDLVNNEEFTEPGGTIRPALPDDLFNTPILIESTKDNSWHYVRMSYAEVTTKKHISHLIDLDLDKDGKLIGVRLAYPFKAI